MARERTPKGEKGLKRISEGTPGEKGLKRILEGTGIVPSGGLSAYEEKKKKEILAPCRARETKKRQGFALLFLERK
jgi:hypothetical protein